MILSQYAALDEISDIGVVASGDVGGTDFNQEICGNVIGVQGVDEYRSCILKLSQLWEEPGSVPSVWQSCSFQHVVTK